MNLFESARSVDNQVIDPILDESINRRFNIDNEILDESINRRFNIDNEN